MSGLYSHIGVFFKRNVAKAQNIKLFENKVGRYLMFNGNLCFDNTVLSNLVINSVKISYAYLLIINI